MSFTVPTFNLTCNIYTGAVFMPPPRVVSPCNLAFGRRNAMPQGQETESGISALAMTLLLPPGTDIRSIEMTTGADLVEVPAGSNRRYLVTFVDDIGKGFPNEHRCDCRRYAQRCSSGQPFPMSSANVTRYLLLHPAGTSTRSAPLVISIARLSVPDGTSNVLARAEIPASVP